MLGVRSKGKPSAFRDFSLADLVYFSCILLKQSTGDCWESFMVIYSSLSHSSMTIDTAHLSK